MFIIEPESSIESNIAPPQINIARNPIFRGKDKRNSPPTHNMSGSRMRLIFVAATEKNETVPDAPDVNEHMCAKR